MSTETMFIECTANITVNGASITVRRSVNEFYLVRIVTGKQGIDLTLNGMQLAALGYALVDVAQFPGRGISSVDRES